MSIHYLRSTRIIGHRPLVAQIRHDFGALVDPFRLHAPHPDLLAGVWMACRESELVGRVPRMQKEVVAVSVSHLNRCAYCVDAHTVMLHALTQHRVARSVRAGGEQLKLAPDLQRLVAWAEATSTPGASILRTPPFALAEGPEIIGTAVFYHYINRMVAVLLDPSPLPSLPTLFDAGSARLAGFWFGRSARRMKQPGLALQFLPKAELPPDMAWAKPNPIIAAAFARWATVVDHVGAQVLPAPVREVTQRSLAAWNGAPPPLGQAWLTPILAELPAVHHAVARLVILTAMAPYRVDAATVAAFQSVLAGDEALLGALAWASFMAARRVGSWLSI